MLSTDDHDDCDGDDHDDSDNRDDSDDHDDSEGDDLHKDVDHKKNSRNSLSTASSSSNNDDLDDSDNHDDCDGDDLQKDADHKNAPPVVHSPQPAVQVSEVHLLSSPERFTSDDDAM